ncbi:YfbU family protein [Pseudoduganella ginsengisoli]|uniref:YfbU family protein n=1 Tax=Pseudoduganella ginsengisoli TaxID=1462440 RepID=A0A6L6Q6E0_9BURK|nr:YfbU family protein [Pseudoduganella ginsengisoli]MTW04989.1 YfbU family protein [Pseudoduganella ginsengisoli]
MELSKKDRIFLINQYKILSQLEKENSSHYLELIEILEYGYQGFYHKIGDWISDEMPEEDSRFVISILDLYRSIENIKRSTKDEKLLSHPMATFPGFDGNNESEYLGFCRFLIDTQGKFQEQEQYLSKNDGMNSHTPMYEKYQRMIAAAEKINSFHKLTLNDIFSILDA